MSALPLMAGSSLPHLLKLAYGTPRGSRRQRLQSAHEVFRHLLGDLLRIERASRPIPFRDPVDRAQYGEAGQLDVGTFELPQPDAVLDQLTHALLELVALANVASALVGVQVLQVRLQDSAEAFVDDR